MVSLRLRSDERKREKQMKIIKSLLRRPVLYGCRTSLCNYLRCVLCSCEDVLDVLFWWKRNKMTNMDNTSILFRGLPVRDEREWCWGANKYLPEGDVGVSACTLQLCVSHVTQKSTFIWFTKYIATPNTTWLKDVRLDQGLLSQTKNIKERKVNWWEEMVAVTWYYKTLSSGSYVVFLLF